MTRKDAIKTLKELWRGTNDPWYEEVYNMAINALEADAPTIDGPQGEWIEVTNGRGGHECSNCHAYAPSYMSGDEHLSDFCPNCGARMKGADDETD